MVFENLKATFLEHLRHTRFISRKLRLSRGSLANVGRAGGYRKDRQVIAPAPLVRTDAADMLKRRLEQAALPAHYSPHSFRATGITNFLENDGILEAARL
jgi:hypothetical protein